MTCMLLSCSKQPAINLTDNTTSENQAREDLKVVLTDLLSVAQNPSFRALVYSECAKQMYGDYYVRISELLDNPKAKELIPNDISKTIQLKLADLKRLGKRNPILFYPSVETKEDNIKLSTKNQRSSSSEVIPELNQPVGVYGDEANPKDIYPGYVLDDNDHLNYFRDIDENFAWENDIWVIGYEENCSPENMVVAPGDTGEIPVSAYGRINGGAEYGGIIQVTDLGAVEPWISGKPEFKMFVFAADGHSISQIAFGKWRRKWFENMNWMDFKRLIGYWNISNWGNWTNEHWIEEDGGSAQTVTLTFPPSYPGGPSVTTTITVGADDDDMGLAEIQFTDPIETVYNISYANIKRKNL